MIGKLKEILRSPGGEWIVSFTTGENPVETFYRLNDHLLDITLKKHTKARSKTANDFCWAMCTDISRAIHPPITKEEVYRKAIRDVGEYEPLPIRADAVETFQKRWKSKGIGWFAEIVDDSKIPGYKLVFAYYGSSTYDVPSMSRLLEYLKDEMENMELPIPLSKAEEERLLSEWPKALYRATGAAGIA